MNTTDQDTTADVEPAYDDSFASLHPMVKFAVIFAALVFLGVVVEGILLTPWTLILHGWTPGPGAGGGHVPPVETIPAPAPNPAHLDTR